MPAREPCPRREHDERGVVFSRLHTARSHLAPCRLRVVPLSLSPSSETRKKSARKIWPREILGAASRPQDLARPFFDGVSEEIQSTS